MDTKVTSIIIILDNVLRNIDTILDSLVNTIRRACGRSHCKKEKLHFDLLLFLHLAKFQFGYLK